MDYTVLNGTNILPTLRFPSQTITFNHVNKNMSVILESAIKKEQEETLQQKIGEIELMSCQYEMLKNIINDQPNISIDSGFHPANITNVEFYPPAVKMTFMDGTVTTAVAQKGDEYSPETGMMVCIMKYIWKTQNFNNTFRKWIKNDAKRKAEAEAAKEEKQKEKERRARKVAKAIARKERKRQEAIEIQKEAYIRATKEMNAGASE